MSLATIGTRYKVGQQYFAERVASGNIPVCSPGYVSGSCQGGHRYATFQFCGKEYCKDCGMDGSPIHQRRVRRWHEKAKGWDNLGYMVVTIPENLRHYFYDANVLRDFRFKLLRKLKESYNIGQGLARYHWFGDCEVCNGIGCQVCSHTGAGDYWHPHLNILIPGGYINDVDEYLQPLRAWVSGYLKKLVRDDIARRKYYAEVHGDFCEIEVIDELYTRLAEISQSSMNINYSFVKKTEAAKVMNRVKYVTRSTYRRYNEDVKKLLHNFRNSIVWGWKRGQVDDDNEAEKIYCPVCEKKGVKHIIHWHKIERYTDNLNIKNESTGETKGTLFRIRRDGGNEKNGKDGDGFTRIDGPAVKREKFGGKRWMFYKNKRFTELQPAGH
jgi:hypothetical protein